jgi:hypothetical protein
VFLVAGRIVLYVEDLAGGINKKVVRIQKYSSKPPIPTNLYITPAPTANYLL